MKRNLLLVVLATFLLAVAISSCQSRRPKCPGIYSQQVDTEQDKNC